MTKRTKAKKFALNVDVVDRCTVEINQAHALHAGDDAKVKNKLSQTKHVLVSCFMGNHDLCRKHSLVCKGGNITGGFIKVHI